MYTYTVFTMIFLCKLYIEFDSYKHMRTIFV